MNLNSKHIIQIGVHDSIIGSASKYCWSATMVDDLGKFFRCSLESYERNDVRTREMLCSAGNELCSVKVTKKPLEYFDGVGF